MKKFMLVLMVALVGGFSKSVAQNTLVATLTHGDNIKMFYGAYALQQAHAAAANGDIINLSSGAFQAVKITKALTIRGAGSGEANSTPTQIINNPTPTYIINDFDIEIPNTVTERLNFEGCHISGFIIVKGTLSHAYFLKNAINSVETSNGYMVNGCFVNNKIYGFSLRNSSTAQFVNCEVSNFYSYDSAAAAFINCNIKPSDGRWADELRNVQLINCILCNDNEIYYYAALPSTASAVNCVAVGLGNYGVFNNLPARQNCHSADFDIFHEGKWWLDLTDEAKAKYLGSDGTPVGMYGGMMPFDLTPSYPRITKMNVASKTSADGKLSVEIEVSATE